MEGKREVERERMNENENSCVYVGVREAFYSSRKLRYMVKNCFMTVS